MGIPGSANLLLLGGGEQAYQIEQSLRFDGSSTYLERTPSSTGNRQKATISFWIKLSKTAAMAVYRQANRCNFRINIGGDGRVVTNTSISSGTNNFQEHTERRRDYSAWYHVLHVIDTTQSTSTNRVRTWFNNVEDNNASWTFPSQNFTTDYNSTEVVRIGYDDGEILGGYLAEFHWLDGQVIWDPGQFGEYDDNGVWRPIEYTGGNYGTNGFYLKFDPSATNGIGHDHSGNGNNFTPTGFTANSTFPDGDVVYDTPTKNFPVINPVDPVGGTHTNFSLSEGNLAANRPSGAGGYTCATFYIPPNTPKFYVELKNRYTTGSQVGVVLGLDGDDDASGGTPQSGFFNNTRRLMYRWNGATTQVPDPPGNLLGANSIVQLAVDIPNGKLWVGVNNTWYQDANTTGGNPSAGTGASDTTLDTTRAYKLRIGSASTPGYANGFWANFGQQEFVYTPPTGFEGLSTALLPAPDIADGSDYFDTKLYNGNTSTNAITGFNFSPDLVWLKSRSHASDQVMYDIIRGANKELRVNTNNTEWSFTDSLNSFDSNGFTLGSDSGNGNVNLSGRTYVAWAWDAGSSNSTNTSGDITSTVRANPSAGFSIVTYTGNGNSNQTVGHGLGVAPDVVILKARNATRNWYVQHKDFTDRTYFGYLNDSGTPYAGPGGNSPFDNGTFNSTVFSVNETGNSETGNGNTETYVAYCFAEIEGYSKFGQYTGNGSLDGPFVYCGFRPAFVMIKREDGGGEWFMVDTARNTYNPSDQDLFANFSYTETSSSGKDLLSNGFKIRESGASMNASGGSFIFMAFAENPFGGEGVSPATAR